MSNYFKVNNPATGKLITEVKINSVEEIKQSLKNGHESFKKWSKVNAHERSRLLKNWSQKIQENKADIAEVMTLENGKPLKESLGEVDYATSYIDWYAEEQNGYMDVPFQQLLKESQLSLVNNLLD